MKMYLCLIIDQMTGNELAEYELESSNESFAKYKAEVKFKRAQKYPPNFRDTNSGKLSAALLESMTMTNNTTKLEASTGREASECSDLLSGVIHNLEYAAFNLCKKTDDDVKPGVIDSTCPETSLFIAIRQLKQIAR